MGNIFDLFPGQQKYGKICQKIDLFYFSCKVTFSVIHMKFTTPIFELQQKQRQSQNPHRNVYKRTEPDLKKSPLNVVLYAFEDSKTVIVFI